MLMLSGATDGRTSGPAAELRIEEVTTAVVTHFFAKKHMFNPSMAMDQYHMPYNL